MTHESDPESFDEASRRELLEALKTEAFNVAAYAIEAVDKLDELKELVEKLKKETE